VERKTTATSIEETYLHHSNKLSQIVTMNTAPETSAGENMDTSLVEENKGGIFNAFSGFLFPKIAPIRWTTFLVLSFLIAIP
jgi:hypothetical protein